MDIGKELGTIYIEPIEEPATPPVEELSPEIHPGPRPASERSSEPVR
jgi:hypothetical protein